MPFSRYCPSIAVLALYTIWSAGIYYLYALNYWGIFLAMASTAVSFILLKKRLECNVSIENVPTDPCHSGQVSSNLGTRAGIQAIAEKILDSGSPLRFARNDTMIVSLFVLLSALNFFILYQSRTADAIISPWQTVPWYFFISFTLTTATLVTIFLRTSRTSTFPLLLFTCYLLQLFSLATIVYAIGFGFDPFVHQATERLIAATGAVDPKPLYYLGQYGLIITLHKLTFIPIALIDKWLVPVLAALLLPPALFTAIRYITTCHREESCNQDDVAISSNEHCNNHSEIATLRCAALAMTTLFIFILPFSIFTLTTPQNLSYVFVTLLILLSLVTRNLSLLTLLALAALAVHPLTGIPAVLFLALYAVSKQTLRYRRSAVALMTLLTAVAVPLALAFNNRTNAAINANQAAPAITELSLPAPFFSGLENNILNVSYLYGFNANYIIILLIVTGLTLSLRAAAQRRRGNPVTASTHEIASSSMTPPRNDTPFSFHLLPYLLTSLALTISYLLTTRVDTSYLIFYERSAFADRLLILAALFVLPFILIALATLVKNILQQERAVRYALLGFLMLLPTAALYHSYPRLDNYFNSRSYPTSAADIEAVRWIESDADGKDYIVLANQQVSAAALRELGFKKYYQTPQGELFFYPIPTGEALYQYYLDMVYERADKQTARQAGELAGVDTVYFVLNGYWWAFDKVRAEAAMEAGAVHAVNGGDAVVFKYTF